MNAIFVSVFLKDSRVPYHNKVALRINEGENIEQISREFAKEIIQENNFLYVRYEIYKRVENNFSFVSEDTIDIINEIKTVFKIIPTEKQLSEMYGIKIEYAKKIILSCNQ